MEKITKETVESKIKKIVENCIHSKVLKDKEPYVQYNGVVGTVYDADSYEEVITDAPDYMYDHIPGGVMMDDGEGGGHDYSQDYFTTVAFEDGIISFNILSNMGTDYIRSISYSIDNGETWTTTENVDGKGENLVTEVEVNAGDKVLWKGDAKQTGYGIKDGSFFSSDCQFNVYGNAMSLLYCDDFKDKKELTNGGKFAYLFIDCNELISAENLILPATTLVESCYASMFSGCTSLTTPPVLPATTLEPHCYAGMFHGCISLTIAPQLPATTLAEGCYEYMFGGCTSLTTAPQLPATSLTERCYDSMFVGCTSLTTAPQLPATSLTSECYYSMFSNCISLITAPQLPATTLAHKCYNSMFNGCTSLTTVPSFMGIDLFKSGYCCFEMFRDCSALVNFPDTLPATVLSDGCYKNMFWGCSSLVKAPKLPAAELTTECYNYMFGECSSLNEVIILATSIKVGAENYTNYWLDKVADSGKVIKNRDFNLDYDSPSGIPYGWTAYGPDGNEIEFT